MIRDEWISLNELAKRLGVSSSTIWTYCSRPEFTKFTKFSNSRSRYNPSQFYKTTESLKMLYDLMAKRGKAGIQKVKKEIERYEKDRNFYNPPKTNTTNI